MQKNIKARGRGIEAGFHRSKFAQGRHFKGPGLKVREMPQF